jgi:ribosomal protein S18 acetylase RimI-like enzyme
MLPKTPGANKVSVGKNLQELFALDKKVTEASPYILPLESPEAFLKFFTKDHKSNMYIWNDEKGNLVGFFSVINLPGEDAMEVLNICIDPAFQRQGYGKIIMLFAEKLAREFGKPKIKLVTSPKNKPAIAFYNSLGYAIIKKIKNYYGNGEPRYVLEKVLTE